MKFSVAIITKNEEEMLPGCLDSISFVEDIVIVDSGSTDKTAEIARARKINFVVRPFTGYADQKNFAIQRAKHDWVLLLDADERLSEALHQEIADLPQDFDTYAAFELRFDTYLLGKHFKHTGFGRERHIRFFNQRRCGYSRKEIHEELEISGSVGALKGRIIHITHRTINHILDKNTRYSDLEAKYLYATGAKKVGYWTLIYKPLREFLYRYVRAHGIFDGIEGLIESCIQAHYVFDIYAKLWELQKDQS